MNTKPRAPSDDLIRILLIEDDPVAHRLISDLLDQVTGARFHIDRAKTLADAWDLLQRGRFDVCLLNTQLPDGDGLELLASAGARGLMLPIVVLHGGEQIDLDRRAMALGAVAFLDKTRLHPTSLERIIRYGIHQQKLTRGLARGALEDESTGLISQTLYRDRLDRAIAFARRNDCQAAVMMIDLAFHPGTQVKNSEATLAEAGRRLAGALRETDTVARLGDRRLALLIEGIRRLDHAALVAKKALQLLLSPADSKGRATGWKPSIGVAVCPSEGISGDTLMRRADAAMRRAMAEGGGRCRFASDRIDNEARESVILEKAFRGAIERRDLRLRFHPEMHLTKRGASLAGEVFWCHPALGWLPIDAQLAGNEDEAPIVEVVDWMLAAAEERLLVWQTSGLQRTRLSLPYPFQRSSTLPILEQAIRERMASGNIRIDRIEFELSEKLVLGDADGNARELASLEATGVRLALDGFGSGEATIQDLRLDLLDGLKLAPSLYRHLPGDERSETFLRAIIGLGHDLDLWVTAKGARDQRQFALLKRLGCDAIQLRGAFPAMSANAATAWLRVPQRDLANTGGQGRAALPEILAPNERPKSLAAPTDQPPATSD